MKVYVKKEDKSSMTLRIIITIIFISFPIGIFIFEYKSSMSFVSALISSGLNTGIFLAFGIYFIYELFKSPKEYKLKLIIKRNETYKGKKITYMRFSKQKEKDIDDLNALDYKCYTVGENNLIVGNDYILKIKEYNWEPKRVEEIDNSKEKKVISKDPHINFLSILLPVGLFFLGLLFLCILGIIIYPEYASTYITFFIVLGTTLFAIYKIIKK